MLGDVLGALSLEDRHTYEAFLAANPERAAALTELAGLPGILNVLSRDEAVALTEHAGDAPAEGRTLNLMPSLASRGGEAAAGDRGAAWPPWGWQPRPLVAMTAGVVGATVFPGSGPVPTEAVELTAMQSTPLGGVNAALAVTEKKWGTRLDWTCEYTKDWADKCGLLRHRRDDRRRHRVGGWDMEPGKRPRQRTGRIDSHPDQQDPHRRHQGDRHRRAVGHTTRR